MNRAQIKSMIDNYLAAECAVLEGKSITMNGQAMTMENLSEIRKGRADWERRLSSFDAAKNGRAPYKLARFP
ncbi:hypothetical protein [Serratia sp. JSRIV006]|jgi:hypothetical protein|uniref:hypothetical protein n=1 Tax=Serratia sp. JSRIV006 TaxID=2831896 RepID=UPI001CC199A2|nr:hypothetical protein [Serratia sp. JSRIV006]UAN65911.1 hypothetical protein KGP16_27460 [Serratia sp. JSRIV006]